jgi:hypothetical protein
MHYVRFTPSLPYGSGQDTRGRTITEKLRGIVSAAGAIHARILHMHFASLGAADAAFKQEAAGLAMPEGQLQKADRQLGIR